MPHHDAAFLGQLCWGDQHVEDTSYYSRIEFFIEAASAHVIGVILHRPKYDLAIWHHNPSHVHAIAERFCNPPEGGISNHPNSLNVQPCGWSIGLDKDHVSSLYRLHLSMCCGSIVCLPANAGNTVAHEIFGFVFSATICGTNAINGHLALLFEFEDKV